MPQDPASQWGLLVASGMFPFVLVSPLRSRWQLPQATVSAENVWILYTPLHCLLYLLWTCNKRLWSLIPKATFPLT